MQLRRARAGGMVHFDTSYWALAKLADPKYGAVGVNYRVVSSSDVNKSASLCLSVP